jgi:hypothetical protein
MNLSDETIKALMTAAIGAVGSIVLMGEGDTKVPIFGIDIPAPILIGAATGLSSFGADLAHDYVLPHIPKNEKLVNMEAAALSIGAGAIGTTGILYYGTGMPLSNWMNSSLLGGGSVVLGDYAHSKLHGTVSMI